ncbi:NUDIX hydrolase [Alteromonas sp. ASW11-36]|uniref:NUDIX hydrolase n=1 Tax=Alteromonas arenosi TaxID=3055817 RepID=A0ABT7SZW2_9ALTE|nr:NUDIX hydrolase [Alteromonas sp. ASW11-36]MDM7861729.1 NUDIX hydrolase [Alteromonas sp. ASW11-36]
MILSVRLRHSAIICVFLLVACSEAPPLPPHCRVQIEAPLPNNQPSACIITAANKLLVIGHRLSGRLDVPGGGGVAHESAACTAHRETFEETGLNTEVTALLGITESGLYLFACQQTGGLTPDKYPQLPVPGWSSTEVTHIEWVDPYILTHDDWRYPDQLVEIKDAYVEAIKVQD